MQRPDEGTPQAHVFFNPMFFIRKSGDCPIESIPRRLNEDQKFVDTYAFNPGILIRIHSTKRL